MTSVQLISLLNIFFNKIANQNVSDVLNFHFILILENVWFDELLPMVANDLWRSIELDPKFIPNGISKGIMKLESIFILFENCLHNFPVFIDGESSFQFFVSMFQYLCVSRFDRVCWIAQHLGQGGIRCLICCSIVLHVVNNYPVISFSEDNLLTVQSVSSFEYFTWQTKILQPLAKKTADDVGFLLVILKLGGGKNAFDECIFVLVLFYPCHQSIHVIPDHLMVNWPPPPYFDIVRNIHPTSRIS